MPDPHDAGGSTLQPQHFARLDESSDPLFYTAPRLLKHIDEPASAAAAVFYGRLLPADGTILDLMSSWASHLPEPNAYREVVGLGLNAVEMRENRQLTAAVLHDLNAVPSLPFGAGAFDAIVLTVSVQYLTRPVEVFRDASRVLRAGAPFAVTFSNRMFPTKAIAAWRAVDDRGHASLVALYFQLAGGFEEIEALDLTPPARGYTDPLYAVVARKAR